jgi:hypothetical protein
MEEELGVLLTFLLHDGAVHGLVLVHEDGFLVEVVIEGDLATVLPLTVDIRARRRVSTGDASKVALIRTSVEEIRDASERETSVNTGEDLAVDAIIVASLIERDVGLATVLLDVVVAVSPASSALDNAVTASLEVGGVTVAVGDSGSRAVVNVVGVKGVDVTEEVLAVE